MSNPSTVYATTFVDELIRSGLKHVCVVPGSRHTPLILAFARHQQHINIYSHLDERSASFFALGLALAKDEPVALVCTSGTAGANFYPAIIEAHQSRVPLIVLTADRPHELRQSGANQTIDQVKMFGDFVLWFYDAPLPEDNPPDVALRNLRTLAARTYATSNGIRKGVVHINMPFRKPLEPDTITPFNEAIHTPQTHITTARYLESAPDITKLCDVLDTHQQGVMICGGNIPQQLAGKLSQLSSRLGYPMFVESVSMMRYGEVSQSVLGGYDTYLDMATMPDVILRFGDVPISKALNDFIVKAKPHHLIHISQDGVWLDDSHLTTWQLHGELVSIVDTLLATVTQRELPKSTSPYTMLEDTTWQVIDREIATGDYFDGAVVYDVVDLIPDGSTLFVGNSLPVRHLDQFGKPNNKSIYVYANRGASGIDGNISTALGAGAGRPDNPLVAIVGDITFYHDMNGLLAVHRCGVPITIVLLNNDGGGIFHRLPIHKHDPVFTEYYVTAHGLDYSHTAKLYGLDYIRADTRDVFRRVFAESVANRTSSIIEVCTDAQADLVRRNDVMSAVRAQLKDLDLFR